MFSIGNRNQVRQGGCGDDHKRGDRGSGVAPVRGVRGRQGDCRWRGWRSGDVRALARDSLDQQVPVAGQRGVGVRFAAIVAGQQLGQPVVRFR